DREQGEERSEQRRGRALVVRSPDDTLEAEEARDQRQNGAPEDDRDDPDQEQVLEHKGALARHRGRGTSWSSGRSVRARGQQDRGKDDAHEQEAEKPRTDRADREG